jgi:exonuclease SbcC
VAVREEQQRGLHRLDKQLADEPRWRQELAAAREATLRLADAEHRLGELRAKEQIDVDAVSHLRAECTRLKAAADKLKANQKILADAGGACPVCRSELGAEGVAHVQAHYAEDLAGLRADYAEAKRQADAGDLGLKQARAAAADLDRQIAELRRAAAQADALEGQIRQAEAWRAERAEAQATHDSAEQQIAAREFEPAAQAELATVAAELAKLGDPSDLARQRKIIDERLRELDKRLRERDKVAGQRHARQDELDRAEVELGGRPALLAEVAELRRSIDENDFAHAIRHEGKQVGDAIDALGYRPEAHAAAREQARDLERWTREEQQLQLAEQRLEADRALLEKADELRARDAIEIERRTREDALLEQDLRELPRAQALVGEQARALADARRTLQAANNDLGEKRGYLKTAQDAADQLVRERENERALAQRQGLFAELSEAFGKKGVQAMLIEWAIPQIEDEANRLLGRMTDNQMHLSFEMQRDTKKGDTVETLEIKIADALGTRIYDAFSGGEAMRANFAVRIALSRLLARRAGARLETLVIDEGFGALDALGRERMVEAITGVQDDFRRIIVITHIDELKDRFPVQIEVTKTPAGSRWEIR